MSDFLGSGRLEDHPFATLTGLIFREARTGELTLESDGRRRTVWYLGGNPVAVVSDDPRDHISQLLLEHGKISAADAKRLSGMAETRDAIGSADFLPKETLNWGVKSRFVNLCYDLFRWEEGDYFFREGDAPRELFMLKVPAHSLIFKGVGLLGLATVTEAVPDDAICAAGSVAVDDAPYLSPDVVKLLEECKPGLSVGQVLGSGWDDIEQTRRLIYALECLGLLALYRGPAAAAAPAAQEEYGFVLDDGGDKADPFSPPEEEPLEMLAPDKPESSGDFSLELPSLDADLAPPSSPVDAGDFPDSSLPTGGYPFDEGSGAGAFGSFDTSSPPGQEEQHTEPKSGGKAGGPKKAGRRLHIPRIAGIALGSLAAVGLIAVAGWWWLGGSEPAPPPARPPAQSPAPAPTPAATVPAVPDALPPDSGSIASAVPPAGAPSDAPPAPAPPPAPVPDPAPEPAQMPAGVPGTDRYASALEIFRAGDLDGAAAIWEAVLTDEHRGDFTLALLTACQRETIQSAQTQLSANRIYLITKKVNGRACFRVCAGTYGSREAAGRALAELPDEFRAAGAKVRPVSDVLSVGR